jgi:hypothetical protein
MMNLPKQSSPVMRSISTVGLSSKKSGVAAQWFQEERKKDCEKQCSNSPDNMCFIRCLGLHVHMRLPDKGLLSLLQPPSPLSFLDRR